MGYVAEDFQNRIARVSWFAHCGEPAYFSFNFGVTKVAMWDEARRYYLDDSWKYAQTEVLNSLRQHLQPRHMDRYCEWNKIAKEVRSFLEDEVMPSVRQVARTKGISDDVPRRVFSDLGAACFENAYGDLGPPIYAMKLLEVYEAGHFPCGWIGLWPEGELVVL